ncbi:MAG: hypothetical protein A2381_01100 [Bdellovibrionales bacterium RIFOXYB1_FULL_37_110]|nr:MAG: hypothetical protein A2417_01955 [Bdellovibrionales bacterium RIFOXYC1_FULL_37_79]OFZ58815.1 MAG: hypothetical protein A2381_01100 [Bdellovibrionales bacterium RIFOXYB1_FULL_37_110]OFZ64814.1 MAG: hypothetical protein A2577_07100 [Bdellovibrionales bacterium RIFOXYD1_FULL_36_51]
MDEKYIQVVKKILAEEADWETGIPRDSLPCIELRRDLVTVIQGVRRCGKSVFMKQIIDYLQIKDRSLYIDFEDPRLSNILDNHLLDAIVSYQEGELGIKNGYYFFDEIRNVDMWEKWQSKRDTSLSVDQILVF